jgi:bacterioferritin-associated ferredoxin
MTIDRCYCYQQSFAALKEVAEETNADSIADLQAHVTFGQNCQLCHPYVRRMLATGQTVFQEVIEEDPAPDPDSS